MNNYQSFIDRINKATTKEDFKKLEESLERLFNNHIFSVKELEELDSKIFEAQLKQIK